MGKAVRNRPRDGGYKATRAQDGRMTGRAIERRLSLARATCPTRPETLREAMTACRTTMDPPPEPEPAGTVGERGSEDRPMQASGIPELVGGPLPACPYGCDYVVFEVRRGSYATFLRRAPNFSRQPLRKSPALLGARSGLLGARRSWLSSCHHHAHVGSHCISSRLSTCRSHTSASLFRRRP